MPRRKLHRASFQERFLSAFIDPSFDQLTSFLGTESRARGLIPMYAWAKFYRRRATEAKKRAAKTADPAKKSALEKAAWLKFKNPDAPAVWRESEEDWFRSRRPRDSRARSAQLEQIFSHGD
jgi:hypothetical protein